MDKNNMKRLIMLMTVIFSLTLFYNFATASVLGSWDVEGLMTVKVKVKGKTATTKSYEQMLFAFNPDETFNLSEDTINILGTWKQKKKNFNVYFSLTDLQQYCDEVEHDVYMQYGITVYVLPKSITLKGTEKKDGTIKGTLTFKTSVYYVDSNKTGNMTLSYPFTGTQQDNIYLQESASFPDLLTDVIAETILDGIDDD